MNCEFEQIDSGIVRCKHCLRTVKTKHPPEKVRAKCKLSPQEPTLAKKTFKVTEAYTRWVIAGFPKRTEEEQAEIRAICNACPLYNTEKDKCTKCGCNLKRKIPIGTEACPEGKWGLTSRSE